MHRGSGRGFESERGPRMLSGSYLRTLWGMGTTKEVINRLEARGVSFEHVSDDEIVVKSEDLNIFGNNEREKAA